MKRRFLLRTFSIVIILSLLVSLTGSALAFEPAERLLPTQPDLQSTLETIEAAVERLNEATGGRVEVSFRRGAGTVSFLRLSGGGDLLPALKSAQPADKAAAFLADYAALFGLVDPAAELIPSRSAIDDLGYNHLSYQQVVRDVPVFGSFLRLHLDSKGRLIAVNGATVPGVKLNVSPALTAEAAATTALQAFAAQLAPDAAAASFDLVVAGNTLYVFNDGLLRQTSGANHLAYEVEIRGPALREFVYVDAHNGDILEQISGIHTGITRELHEPSYPNLKWVEGDAFPTPNSAWNDELNGANETYDFYKNITGGSWLSFDGNNATMITVNLDGDPDCPNAWWDGSTTNYCPDVTGDDTVAHEWTHAFTQYTHNLIYSYQSGALNEATSDIFGEIVDMVNGRGLDSPDAPRTAGSCSTFGSGSPSVDQSYRWLSGEDDPAFNGAIRDLWNPVCYGDPGKVSDSQYECTDWDNGGVHTNSGVPNHGFALLVDGGVYNGQTVSGIGLTKAAHIYWRAMSVYQGPSTTFPGHADALEQSCQDLLGVNLRDPANGNLSGEVLTASDCDQVTLMKLAVEFDEEPTQCGFEPLLDPDAPALCAGEAGDPVAFFHETWEVAALTPGGWTMGSREVANPATFDTPDWAVVGDLPGGGSPVAGSTRAAFVEDNANYGDCGSDIEAGVLWLQSPEIVIPAGAATPRLAFDHWLATEEGWDGGNVKLQVNGGPWTLVPASAFDFNAYPGSLYDAVLWGSDNPLAGEEAFTGENGGTGGGSWGQSQIDLAGRAGPGDTVSLRFEMGLDGCNGVVGWYVDDVQAYYCGDGPAQHPNIEVAPASLSSNQLAGETVNKTLTISNTGDAALNWEIDEGVTACNTPEEILWASVSPIMGATMPGQDSQVEVTFDSSGKSPGTYQGKLCINSNDPDTPLAHLPLTLTVEDPGGAPNLSIPEGLTGFPNRTVSAPIEFTGNGKNIASLVFSVDFDETCLAFDPSDDNSDGLPDAVTFDLPAAFDGAVTYDAGDSDGELDFLVADTFPPLAALSDGVLARVEFLVTCNPGLPVVVPPGDIAPVGFSADPAASFGDTTGTSVSGTTSDGWVEIMSGTPGDCNADGAVDAGDISALVLEIFDGDGSDPLDAPTGSFPGDPVGCDTNEDVTIDAGDISCAVLLIFDGPGACGALLSSGQPQRSPEAAAGQPALTLLNPAGKPGGTQTTSLLFDGNGHAISSLAFSLAYDPTAVSVDPDAVSFYLPAGFDVSLTVDARAGRLDALIADPFAPLSALPSGRIASIPWQATGPGQTGLRSAADLAPSFGDTEGRSVGRTP